MGSTNLSTVFFTQRYNIVILMQQITLVPRFLLKRSYFSSTNQLVYFEKYLAIFFVLFSTVSVFSLLLKSASLLLEELRKADAYKIFYMQKIHEHSKFIPLFRKSILRACQTITDSISSSTTKYKLFPLRYKVKSDLYHCIFPGAKR